MVKPGYKQTEIGEIPEDWEVKPLKAIAPLQRGFDLPYSQIRDGKFPVVFSNGIGAYHNDYMVKGPGVVTGRSGTIGKVHYVHHDYWPHNTSLWVTNFNKNNSKFIYYLFQTINWDLFNSGSGVPTLNRNDIHDTLYSVPPISEQERIAEALSDVGALIASLEKLIAKKKAIKQGAMQRLLTGKTRLPGFEGKLKKTELGEIPEDWEVVKLGSIAEIHDGTHQTPHYVPYGIPFYSVEHVTNRDFTNTKYIDESEHNFLTRYFRIEKGDILMTRIGSIGECVLIDWDVNASFYVSLALLKVYGAYAPYIASYSETSAFKKEVELHSLPFATPKKINLGPIASIRVLVPSKMSEQVAIADFLSNMNKEIESLTQKLAKTRQLKQGMMQQLLTGKIRLV